MSDNPSDQPSLHVSRLSPERRANMLEHLRLYRSLFIAPARQVLALIRSYIPSKGGGTAHAVFIRDIRDKLLQCYSQYTETFQMSAYSPHDCRDFLFPFDHFPRLSAALAIYSTALEKLVRESEKWPSPDLQSLQPYAVRVRVPPPASGLVEECEAAVQGFEIVLDDCEHTIQSCLMTGHEEEAHVPSIIISLGDGRYGVAGHEPVKVSEREDVLLRSFLNKSPLSKSELASATGMSAEDAVTVLRSLKGTQNRAPKYNSMFAAAIRLPGKRGAGGYHVSIRLCP